MKKGQGGREMQGSEEIEQSQQGNSITKKLKLLF